MVTLTDPGSHLQHRDPGISNKPCSRSKPPATTKTTSSSPTSCWYYPILSHAKNRILRRKSKKKRTIKIPYYPAFPLYYPVNPGKQGKRGPYRPRMGYPHLPRSGYPFTDGRRSAWPPLSVGGGWRDLPARCREWLPAGPG